MTEQRHNDQIILDRIQSLDAHVSALDAKIEEKTKPKWALIIPVFLFFLAQGGAGIWLLATLVHKIERIDNLQLQIESLQHNVDVALEVRAQHGEENQAMRDDINRMLGRVDSLHGVFNQFEHRVDELSKHTNQRLLDIENKKLDDRWRKRDHDAYDRAIQAQLENIKLRVGRLEESRQ